LFLSAAARMALSSTRPSLASLDLALLRMASAGEALERGPRATGAPSAGIGGIQEEALVHDRGRVLSDGRGLVKSGVRGGDRISNSSGRLKHKFPRWTVVVPLASLLTVPLLLLVRHARSGAGPSHLCPFRCREVQGLEWRWRGVLRRGRTFERTFTQRVVTDGCDRGELA
jgi:hypothetical protein